MQEDDIKDIEYLDYYKLKEEAIEYLNKIGGEKWNYYEENDPGITILENLCFAIMDLDYRIKFPIEDILAEDPQRKSNIKPFFKPEEILPTSPVTLNDYYKIILDVDGVRNCKIFLNRCSYDILLQIEQSDKENQENVINEVKNKLNENRNLCEYFNNISIFDTVDIYVDMILEPNLDYIHDNNDYDSLIGKILSNIQEYFIPKIKFRTLSEALEIKKNLDDIYEGPLLKHGFILDEDLEKNFLQNRFYLIDILDILNSEKKIWRILHFSLYNAKTNLECKNFIDIQENQIIKVIFDKSNIVLIHNNDVIKTNKNNYIMFAKRFYILSSINNNANTEEIGIYPGKYRNLLQYKSIQEDFPLNYCIGEDGISDEENDERKIQINNFKSYLLIFDQFLSIYLQKLENVKNILAIDSDKNNYINYYCPKNIPNIDNLLQIPSSNNSDNGKLSFFEIQKKYFKIKSKHVNGSKYKICDNYINDIFKHNDVNFKKKVIDHLLARFDEHLSKKEWEKNDIYRIKKQLLRDYSYISTNRFKSSNIHLNNEYYNIPTLAKKISILFDVKYRRFNPIYQYIKRHIHVCKGSYDKSIEISLKDNNFFLFKAKIKDIFKHVLLYGYDDKNYSIIKKRDINYTGKKGKCNAQYKILLYIDKTKENFIELESVNANIDKYNIAKDIVEKAVQKIKEFSIYSEGFYLIEHALLCKNCNFVDINDDECFKITIIFPDWPYRFQKESFKKEIYEWIYDNTPAHLYVNILWLNIKQMEIFECAYMNLIDIQRKSEVDNEKISRISRNLLQIITNISLTSL